MAVLFGYNLNLNAQKSHSLNFRSESKEFPSKKEKIFNLRKETISNQKQKKSSLLKDNRKIFSPQIEANGLKNFNGQKPEVFFPPTNVRMNTMKTKSANPDSVTITFNVIGDPWGDGSGFQMLLDSKCQMIGKAFDSEGHEGMVQVCFELADYTIPQRANMEFENLVMLRANESATVTIPAGEYDYIFFNPAPNDEFQMVDMYNCLTVDGDLAYGQSFTFLGGYDYLYVIENSGKTPWPGIELYPPLDIELVDLILPSGENADEEESIQLVFANIGQIPVSGIDLLYQVNEDDLVNEFYDGTVQPGDTIVYTFETKANFSKNDIYIVDAGIIHEEDLHMENNFIQKWLKLLPLPLPFSTRFDSSADTRYYMVLDNNQDDATWYFDELVNAGENGGGSMRIGQYDVEECADDYLLTEIIRLPEAGDYHISFDALSDGTGTESFQILYGTSRDIDTWTILADYPSYDLGNEWISIVNNFSIPTAGDYYFAIRYYSCKDQDRDVRALNVDNISIEQGKAPEKANLYLRKVLQPVSSCDLGAAVPVTVVISNIGTIPTSKIIFNYSVNNSENTKITEELDKKLDAMKTMTYTFNTPLNLSDTGSYSLKINVATEGDVITDNNQKEIVITHFEPVETLPFKSDFSNSEDIKEWNSTISDGWAINEILFEIETEIGTETVIENVYQAQLDSAALFSRCIHLPAGKYCFSYTFLSGIFTWGSSFYVAYGKSGTDPVTWDPAIEYNGISTDKPETNEIIIEITEEDDYSIAFVPTRLMSKDLHIFNTSLSKYNVGISPVNIDSRLLLSPNPVKDILTVKAAQTIEKITISDVTGKTVYRIDDINVSSYPLNVNMLAAGVYFVTVQTGAGLTTSQIIVK
jgi:hypothetical protein